MMNKLAYVMVSYLALIMFISCVQQKSYTIKTPFRPEDWKLGLEAGNCRLEGKATLKTNDGEIKTCAGEEVILMPYNSYTEELYKVGKQGGFSEASNFDQSIKSYLMITTCDIDGNFEFDNLPSGKWLIYTQVVWQIPGRDGTGVQGGDMIKIFQTIENNTQKVYLSEENRSY
ncbi:MAG: hypothetical protein PVF37_23470 [Desulfobacterales bacterium]|jgi:hypothetical protein